MNINNTDVLGEGTFATVKRRVMNGQPFARKYAKSGDAAMAAIMHEYRMLIQLDHPHVIHILNFGNRATTALRPFLDISIMSFSLYDRIFLRPVRMTADFVIETMHGMLCALVYLENRNIANLDIKPENVLISAGGSAHLADFGLSRQLGGTPVCGAIGTMISAAPENLRGNEELTTRADVWSMGITFFSLFSLKFPYAATRHELSQRQMILDAQHTEPGAAFSAHVVVPDAYLEIVNQMLTHALEQRPTAANLLTHFAALPPITHQPEQLEIARLNDALQHAQTSLADLNVQLGAARRAQLDDTNRLEEQHQQDGLQIAQLQQSVLDAGAAREAHQTSAVQDQSTLKRNFQQTINEQEEAAKRARIDVEKAVSDRDQLLKRIGTVSVDALNERKQLEARIASVTTEAARDHKQLEEKMAADAADARRVREELEARLEKYVVEDARRRAEADMRIKKATADAAEMRSELDNARAVVFDVSRQRDEAVLRGQENETGSATSFDEMRSLKEKLQISENRRRAQQRQINLAKKALIDDVETNGNDDEDPSEEKENDDDDPSEEKENDPPAADDEDFEFDDERRGSTSNRSERDDQNRSSNRGAAQKDGAWGFDERKSVEFRGAPNLKGFAYRNKNKDCAASTKEKIDGKLSTAVLRAAKAIGVEKPIAENVILCISALNRGDTNDSSIVPVRNLFALKTKEASLPELLAMFAAWSLSKKAAIAARVLTRGRDVNTLQRSEKAYRGQISGHLELFESLSK